MKQETVRVAVLNNMFGNDILDSIARQSRAGISDLDLKDSIFGKRVVDLSQDEARTVVEAAGNHGMSVYCMSTVLFSDQCEIDGEEYRASNLGALTRALHVATVLQPRFIRLLPPKAPSRSDGEKLSDFLERASPWLVDTYREAVGKILDAGFTPTIENETGQSLLRSVEDIQTFFDAIDPDGSVSYTWDAQNLWSMSGEAPSVDVYRALRPLIQYVHVKGGIEGSDRRLGTASTLSDATWPVREVLTVVAADGSSPVIGINPPHGRKLPTYDREATALADVRFVQALLGTEVKA